MFIAITAESATIWVAAISAIGALFVALANNRLNRKAQEPIEGTYAAVNSGRMQRIEEAVFAIQSAVARLEGKISALEDRDKD